MRPTLRLRAHQSRSPAPSFAETENSLDPTANALDRRHGAPEQHRCSHNNTGLDVMTDDKNCGQCDDRDLGSRAKSAARGVNPALPIVGYLRGED